MPKLAPIDSAYKKGGSVEGAALLCIGIGLIVACVLVAIFRPDAWATSVVGIALAVPLSLLGAWALKSAKTARYVVDATGISVFDWRDRFVERIEWKDVVAFGPKKPSPGGRLVWLAMKSLTQEIRIPLQMEGIPLLTMAIIARLPEGVEPIHIKPMSQLSRTMGTPLGQRRTFGHLNLVPEALFLVAMGIGAIVVIVIAIVGPEPDSNGYALIWVPALFLGLGVPATVAAINDKCVVDQTCIQHIDWRARIAEEIAWDDITAFIFERRTSGKGGSSDSFMLISKESYISLDSSMFKWKELKEIILDHLSPNAYLYLGRFSDWP